MQPISTRHKFGQEQNISYNSRTQRLTPSDMNFVLFTLILNITPSLLAISTAVWFNPDHKLGMKLIFTLSVVFTFSVSVRNLY